MSPALTKPVELYTEQFPITWVTDAQELYKPSYLPASDGEAQPPCVACSQAHEGMVHRENVRVRYVLNP